MNNVQHPPSKQVIALKKSQHAQDLSSVRPKSLFEKKQHYLSEANIKYNFKGEANTIRSKLDERKKQDLR